VSEVAIRVENLSKNYRLGEIGGATLREDLHRWWAGLRGTPDPTATIDERGDGHPADGALSALRDVSFEVRQGEVLGIVGSNGAGKSTLLKVLSRITAPTSGRVKIRGRVGSLLEVGTGFHPDLTGRENIYLNGAILGMRKVRIDQRMEEIIDFAGIERFLDTPVKRYSSGMYVRLAFAVAAHLEPEILIVDEVLAVGDAQFQRKCIGKMSEVGKGGRTVLFVSHNMPAIIKLCTRCIVLGQGQIVLDGSSEEAVERYLAEVDQSAAAPLRNRTDRRGNGALRFTTFELQSPAGEPLERAKSGLPVVLALRYESTGERAFRNVHIAIAVRGPYDEHLFHLSTGSEGEDFSEVGSTGTFSCELPCVALQPGRYPIDIFCAVNGVTADWVRHAGVLDVAAGDFFGSGRLPPLDQGPFLAHHRWRFTPTEYSGVADKS